jgi:hypothetical protein
MAEALEARSERDGRYAAKLGSLAVAALEEVVRDARAQVVDMVETDAPVNHWAAGNR